MHAWAAVQSRSGVLRAELTRADELYHQIEAAFAQRGAATATSASASNLRQRAFTLFARAYDEARRAVAYLRWHEGDAEQIAPSLYAGRGKAKGNAATKPAQDANAAPPAQPAAPEPTTPRAHTVN